MKSITKAQESDAGGALAGYIEPFLVRGERVLLLLSGGSCTDVAVDACARLRSALRGNLDAQRLLSVTLADERYGPINHTDSNWRLLLERGFDPSSFDAVPVLDGVTDGRTDQGLEATAARFGRFLSLAAERHTRGTLHIAAVFGIGSDGHTAGILPHSSASMLNPDGSDYATGYNAVQYERITIAPAFFRHIDYAVVWVNDRTKRNALDMLLTDGTVEEIPARLIERAREAILFTGENL
jgi:6-phosphogluconolactonase/glucosamine-6-phosphate isomerase/deaminase